MSIPLVRQALPNPHAAVENRRLLDSLGVVGVNVLGGSGTGKTAVLEAILPRLQREVRVGVVQGALCSTCDAQRISSLRVPVVQVFSDGQCHLAANQVQRGLAELPLDKLHLVFIENLGSQVCAPEVDLGEHIRLVVLSVTAGATMAEKYPRLFRAADMILLTKCDLLPHVRFDLQSVTRRLRRLNPAAEIICTDVCGRMGIDRVAGWLLGYVRAQGTRAQEAGRTMSPAHLPS